MRIHGLCSSRHSLSKKKNALLRSQLFWGCGDGSGSGTDYANPRT